MKRAIALSAALVSLVGTFFAFTPRAAADAPARITIISPDSTPPMVSIHRITQAGSGCPGAHAPEARIVAGTLLFVEAPVLQTKVAGSSSPSLSYTFCQTLIELEHSPGWSYRVAITSSSGFADLDSGVKGVIRSELFFPGEEGISHDMPLLGPYHEAFQWVEPFNDDAALWSPCGSRSPLSVKRSLRLDKRNNPEGRGHITLSASSGFNAYYLRWRKCSP